ncbi:MAG: carbon-nitrogen hydrolase family protein [Polyangiales bacterium]
MSQPSTLRVGALEIPYRHGAPDQMLRRLDDALAQTTGLDLVLPCEAALTGYVSRRGDFDLTRYAEPLDGTSVTAMRAMARAHGVALGVPWIERDGARCFNSYLVVDRDGEALAHYRKRRPWFPERWATPGDLGTPGFSLGGVRLTIAVCYDIHFVSRMAAAALAEADALLFPSSWVDDGDDDLRDALLPRVARRHGVWVVNANWGEGAPVRYGVGLSRIVRPDGVEVARAAPGGANLVVAAVTRRHPGPC